MTSNDAGPARYHVRPGRRRALVAALTGRGIDLGAERVTDRCPPQQAPPARYRHAPEVRLCCNSGSADPHETACPVYTPGGSLRELPEPDGKRACCPSNPGGHHVPGCALTPGQRAVLAEHEALAFPFEPFRARMSRGSGSGVFYCRGCDAELKWRGAQLLHPDPMCEGMTGEQIAAIRYGLAQ